MFGGSHDSHYFSTAHSGSTTIVRVHGPEVRHPQPAEELGADVWKLVEVQGVRDVLIDLAHVRYMSSTGFAVLVGLAEKIKSVGGRLAICGIQPDVAIGADIIGLGRMVATFGDETDALRYFESPTG